MEINPSAEKPKTTHRGLLSELLNSSPSQANVVSTTPRVSGLLSEVLASPTHSIRGRANSDFIFSALVPPTSPGPRARSYSSPREQLGLQFRETTIVGRIPKPRSPIAQLAAEDAYRELIESHSRQVLQSILSRAHPLLANILETNADETATASVVGTHTHNDASEEQFSSQSESGSDEDIFHLEPNASGFRI